ncbi:vWA domain-containing protein [Actinoplanes solisilvae]|uniref:vWA domain-containing protein n=1 Tax=Actinoplanes solisilvae TaxID=2486853 RepID=UPI000FD6F146|nr:VWA domain-containing protein [Actinoplanes solisilvae]
MTPPDPSRPPGLDPSVVERAEDHLVGFLRGLRARGLAVPVNKQVDFFAGIEVLRPAVTGQLYWIGVATLLTSELDRAVYDEVFERFFGIAADAVVVTEEAVETSPAEGEEPTGVPGDSETSDALLEQGGRSGLAAGRVSPEAVVRFAATEDRAREVMRQLCGELSRAVPRTRSRRSQPGGRRQLDLRSTYHASRRTRGEIVRLFWRHRPLHERRVLVLVDVSGSMKQYSADYLRFAHTVVATCRCAEVFTFGTRLTRVTSALRAPDVDVALAALARLVLDAEGGTQIGASLRTFLDNARFVTMARGALVLVLSDGLERGDPTAMVDATRRLSRLSHRLNWWSPLACDPSYQPLTRAMSAVHPDLDALTGVRDLVTALTAVRDLGAGLAATPRLESAPTAVRESSAGNLTTGGEAHVRG